MLRHLAGAAAALALWTASSSAAPLEYTIDAAQVPAYIAHEHPVILVATGGPDEKKMDRYLAGAVAVNELTWTGYSNAQEKLDSVLDWARYIGGQGIDGTRPVLVYDDGSLKFASRLRYLLAHFGVRKALLVNGGWEALEGLPGLQTQPEPSTPVGIRNIARVVQEPIPIAPRLEVRAIVEDYLKHRPRNVTLIDVRTIEEYTGEKVLKPGEKPGHIPGAINLPVSEFLDPIQPNMPLRPTLLAAVFAKYKIDRNSTLIFYCQDGARSSLGATAAKEAYIAGVKLYYLSFLDWQRFDDDPIVTGSNPAGPMTGKVAPKT